VELCSVLIYKISKVNLHLGQLIKVLPPLSASCKDFSTKAHEISNRRTINRVTLQSYPLLLELLEIPQLMDTCVRSGLYEEALELEAFAQKFLRVHPESLIVQQIVRNNQTSI
jgi:hypothetical protein